MKKFLKTRRAKYGMMTAGMIAIVIVAVLLCNIILTLLVSHFDWKVDLTSNKLYQISDTTSDFLKDYEQDATIYVLEDEMTFKNASKMTAQAYNILKNMADENPKITLSFVDLDTNPDFYSEYSDVSLSAGGVLVVGTKTQRHQFFGFTELFSATGSSYSSSTEYLSLVEQKVAHSLEYVAGVNPIHATILQGHQEMSLDPVETLFAQNNYECDELNLLTGTISEDTDLIMIAAPTVDYTQDEIAKLDAFLDQGGNLGKTVVYFASGGQPTLPNLEAFLSKWGIDMEDGAVLETDTNRMLDNPFEIYVDAVSSQYTQNAANMDLPVLTSYIKGMKIGTPQDSSVTVDEFCSTSDSCIFRPTNAGDDWNYRSAERKSYPVALGAEKVNEDTQKYSRVLCFASVGTLSYLGQPTLGNDDLVMSSMSFAANKPSKVSVEPKTLTKPALSITSAEAGTLGLLFMLIIPIGIAIAGIVSFMRRKDR